MNFSVGCRLGLDPVLLWLWCRLAAVAPIRPLAWKLPYAMGVALKKKTTDQKKKKATSNWYILLMLIKTEWLKLSRQETLLQSHTLLYIINVWGGYFELIQICSLCLNFHLCILAFMGGLYPWQLLRQISLQSKDNFLFVSLYIY